jgi:hypothetical protein
MPTMPNVSAAIFPIAAAALQRSKHRRIDDAWKGQRPSK